MLVSASQPGVLFGVDEDDRNHTRNRDKPVNDEIDAPEVGLDDDSAPEAEGLTPPGQAQIRSEHLSFVVRGYFNVEAATKAKLPQPPVPPAPADYEAMRRHAALYGVAAAMVLEGELASVAPSLRIRAYAHVRFEPTAAGPGEFLPEIFALVLGDDPLGRISQYIEIGGALAIALKWLRDHGAESLQIDGGMAIPLASKAVDEAGGPKDLTIQFVQEIHAVADEWFEWESDRQGYLVAFRDNGTLYQVPVTLDGKTGAVSQVSIDVLRPSDDQEDDI